MNARVPAPPSPGSKLPGYVRPSYGRRGTSFLVLVPKGRTRIAREFIPATQRGEALRSLSEQYCLQPEDSSSGDGEPRPTPFAAAAGRFRNFWKDPAAAASPIRKSRTRSAATESG